MATHMEQKSMAKSGEEMEKTSEEVLFPQPTLARIKNKQRRQELYKKMKQEKKKVCQFELSVQCLSLTRMKVETDV